MKPYGFPIHGCICGYSRRIIWLEVAKSNNNPKIPARFYLDALQELNGCPSILQTDCGTENVIIAAMQSYLRANGDDEFAGEKAHRYGSSPANQRIEGWWSFFKRSRTSWWINLFKDMTESGELELGRRFHMENLWFCYNKIIQKELDQVRDHWNSHYIRKSRHDTIPGVPDILYYLPERTNATDCSVPVSDEKISELEPQCHLEEDEDIYAEYFQHVMEIKDWGYPSDEYEAFSLFQNFNFLNR